MYTCIKHPYLYGLLYLLGYRLYIILQYYVSCYYVPPEPGYPLSNSLTYLPDCRYPNIVYPGTPVYPWY